MKDERWARYGLICLGWILCTGWRAMDQEIERRLTLKHSTAPANAQMKTYTSCFYLPPMRAVSTLAPKDGSGISPTIYTLDCLDASVRTTVLLFTSSADDLGGIHWGTEAAAKGKP